MTSSSHHIQACMEAWLNCENLLLALAQRETPVSNRTLQVVDECAQICMGTMHALKRGMQHINQLALLCVGICEECAEVCERYNENLFDSCASACRRCSTVITSLASAAV